MIRCQFIFGFAVALLCGVAQAQELPDRCKLHFTGFDPSEQPERVRVESLTIRGATNLDPALQKRAVEDRKTYDYDDRGEMIDEVREMLRLAWQEQGYFEAQVDVTAEPIGTEDQNRYRVTAKMREGDQFRVGGVSFESAGGREKQLAISGSDLRQMIPLKDGEIFDLSKFRTGLDTIRHAYNSEGYIDFTSDLDFAISHKDKEGTISIRVTIDEQAQYRVSDISVLGLDPRLAQELSAHLPQGTVYDATAFNEFFAEFVAAHKRELPVEAGNQDLYVIRNTKARTVAIRADFRACSEIPK